ncbi:helix-turn-helix domain-containing protein [Saxibacter everestensis]|uniref:Helix-turn-helix domain-containing protein n=1 Tax=Saxibacter everestensis TaxID=2909229 RepID=A0ABY8QYU1_9MICO|nr:helix-turn-helix domain-containing protein [Brevibacteriaceae bacterium ZFBP1038]
MAVAEGGDERRIRADEPTGVLHPANLSRYDARWIDPDPRVADVVDQYWAVRWSLDDGEMIDQAIIDLPAINLTIEAGDVPAGLLVTGLHERAWFRRITGTGDVFAIRLRPAGLAVLSSLRPEDLVNQTIPITAELDAGLHELMTRAAGERTAESRSRAVNDAIADRMRQNPPQASHLLANRVLDELRARAYNRTSTPLAERFGISERTIQRALSQTLGIGPKQVARRIRLQEAAQAIAIQDDDRLTELAVQLGYSDQAHLTSDFRATTGTTPGAYRRILRQLTASAEHR